jgi:hypothetical protein
MRLTKVESSGVVTGYTLRLSGRETYAWAHCPGKMWPCSYLSDSSLQVTVDGNGLCDTELGGDVPANELEAVVADHLPADCQHLWPCWEAITETPPLSGPSLSAHVMADLDGEE